MELPLDIAELILSYNDQLIKIGAKLSMDLYRRLVPRLGENPITTTEFTNFMYTTPRTIFMFKHPIIYPEWLRGSKWIAEWDIYTFNPQASRQHYINNNYRLSQKDAKSIYITQHTDKLPCHPTEFNHKPFLCAKFVDDIINIYKDGNILFDALTYYRIMSDRLSCQKINSNYAKSKTQKYFSNNINNFSQDTSTDILKLFCYLMGNVETFNINIPLYHIYYHIISDTYTLMYPGPSKTVMKNYDKKEFVQFCSDLKNRIICDINRLP